MQQQYQLTLHSQMGPREGTLALQREGDGSVWGTLFLAGYENQVRGTWNGEGVLTLFHSLRTAVGDHACRSVLRLVGGTLQGTAELGECKLKWSGKRLEQEQAEEKRCE